MGRVIAGLASSHAFALLDPAEWSEPLQRNRAGYARRYGELPPVHPRVAQETDADVRRRHARITDGLAYLRRRLDATRPDALIFVGDDQNENFTESNLPQIAIYLGDQFRATSRDSAEGPRYRCAPGLATAILHECVEADIDMAAVRSLPDDRLFAHAFGPVLQVVDPDARIPVVPVFVNAIHVPAPSPGRCYYLGKTIRRAVERSADGGRVAIFASGGLSHFTAGYPWPHYEGPFAYGSISEEFDRALLSRLEGGEGHALAELTSKELLDHGEIELRSWITMLGAIGDARPERLVYEPFYRGIMGMGIGCWDLEA
jgi:Catalytic LigB subunit of aromatic ring-opening dioxygenase